LRALEGFVEGIFPKEISGWARDADAPDVRQEIRIEVDGAIVGRTIANIFRPDLLAKGKGDGKYGFRAILDRPMLISRDNFRCLAGEHDDPLKIVVDALPVRAKADTARDDGDFSKAAFPVFIFGSPRSGTSVLAAALRAAGYVGFNEGHLLSLLPFLNRVIDAHFAEYDLHDADQLLSHVDKEKTKHSMASVLKTIQEATQPGGPWFDKTPGPHMYSAAPYLRELWPGSKFIFAKRRGIENIVSRTKKFPSAPFAFHCRDWVSVMSGWRALRETGLDHLEIDQFDIARQPIEVAERLGFFLNLPKSSIDAIARTMAQTRPQATSADSPEKVYSLESTGWSEEQIAVFKSICAAEMEAFGYSYDESYRRR
jgi:hypothetical protein